MHSLSAESVVVQEQSACLSCVRSWVLSPAPQNVKSSHMCYIHFTLSHSVHTRIHITHHTIQNQCGRSFSHTGWFSPLHLIIFHELPGLCVCWLISCTLWRISSLRAWTFVIVSSPFSVTPHLSSPHVCELQTVPSVHTNPGELGPGVLTLLVSVKDLLSAFQLHSHPLLSFAFRIQPLTEYV